MKDQLNSDREASLSNGMPKITAENVNVYYEEVHALKAVSYTHLTLPTSQYV